MGRGKRGHEADPLGIVGPEDSVHGEGSPCDGARREGAQIQSQHPAPADGAYLHTCIPF
jgi:hypothetical protein